MDLLETGSEYRHPWELSRADCLIKCFLEYSVSNLHPPDTVADIGCGDLFFSGQLASFFSGKIFAVDTGFENDSVENLTNITVYNDIDQIENNSIDVVILMDVLEHVEDLDKFLTGLSKKLTDKAVLFITVPAFMHLFSEHDVFLKHHRRYNKKSLSAVLADNGFRIERLFYFYSSLYILRLLQFIVTRLISKRMKNSDKMVGNLALWKKEENSLLTRFIRAILNLDFRANKTLGRFSLFGLSLFAKCDKGPV